MDDFNNLEYEVTFRDAIGEELTFTSCKSISEFLEEENSFWNEKYDVLGNNEVLRNIKSAFNNSLIELNKLKNLYQNLEEDNHKIELNNVINRINVLLKKTTFSKTPFASKLLEVIPLGKYQTETFWKYLITPEHDIPNLILPASFQGAVLAYEYLFQDESSITKRRESEKKTLGLLRKQLADKNNELITKSETLFDSLSKSADSFKGELSSWKQLIEENLAKQLEVDRSENKQFCNDSKIKIEELEKLYSEKLKLEKPAKYWKDQADHFRTVGFVWGGFLIFITLCSIGLFAYLFYQWLQSGKIIEKFSAEHWQGIILLAAVLSLAAYLIRIFGKLTFSSFHLQRDAEEREQLCYLYLALSNETAIDENSRKIILQSLFSRSDSGLLSGDHGPTMPGISDLISKRYDGN